MVPSESPLTFRSSTANRWLFAALVVAIAANAVDLYQFESFEFDKVNHVAATASWLAGRGFTIPDVAPTGLPDGVYRPLLGFPPGYALALAPIMRATDEVWWSTYALDVAAQALFLAGWAATLSAATGSAAVAAGMLCLWTLTFSPIEAGTYSDLLALAMFSASMAAGIAATRTCGGSRVAAVVCSAAFMAAACVTRYAYWPLIVVVPVALVAATRDRLSRQLAILHLMVAATAILATRAFMHRTTGEALFLSRWYPDERRGLFWSHLLAINPFPADGLGVSRVYALAARGRPTLTALRSVAMWTTSAVCASIAGAYVWSRVRRAIDSRSDAAETFFTAAGLLTCAATVAMNLWLTLRLPATSDGWTVGGEPRYYLPVLPFLGAWIWLAVRDRSFERPRIRRLATMVVAAVVIVTVAIRAVRIERYAAENVQTAWMSHGRRAQAEALRAAIRTIDTGSMPPLLVDESPKWRRYVATMAGALVVTPAQLAACAGHDARQLRFLAAQTRAEPPDGPTFRGTPVGTFEHVPIVLVSDAPCGRSSTQPRPSNTRQ